jgi:hypothetical protein
MGNIIQRGPRLSADIHHDLIEKFARHMMPDSKFADSAKSIYPQN